MEAQNNQVHLAEGDGQHGPAQRPSRNSLSDDIRTYAMRSTRSLRYDRNSMICLEHCLVESFLAVSDWEEHMLWSLEWRTFALIVAEALEGPTPLSAVNKGHLDLQKLQWHPKLTVQSVNASIQGAIDASRKRQQQGLEPMVPAANRWPSTPQDIRHFIGQNFSSRKDANPSRGGEVTGTLTGEASEDDIYTLSVHDLLSAFTHWALEGVA